MKGRQAWRLLGRALPRFSGHRFGWICLLSVVVTAAYASVKLAGAGASEAAIGAGRGIVVA